MITKKAAYEACVKRQEELIANFSAEVEEIQGEMTSHDHSPSQTDHNPAAEQQAMYQVMHKELDFLKYEMRILRDIDLSKEFTEVDMGALVITDKRTFFVCVSIEEVEADGYKVFGLSTDAPIYQKMKGKKKGESFEMNGINYDILDIL
jgi:transcription elongation GreA/GreB family factor